MSSIQGINFNGMDSISFAGLVCIPHPPMLPEKRRSTIEVFGRDGLYDFNINSYAPRTLPVDFKLSGGSRDTLRAFLNQAASWLSGTGYLILNYNNTVRWTAKAYAPVDVKLYPSRAFFTVNFECNPPWAEDVTATIGTIGSLQDYGSQLPFYPAITVNLTGAATYVQVTLTGGNYVRVSRTYAANDILVMDMSVNKATANGMYVPVTIDSLFFSVPPGLQQINVTSDGGFAASISYRKRYPYA